MRYGPLRTTTKDMDTDTDEWKRFSLGLDEEDYKDLDVYIIPKEFSQQVRSLLLIQLDLNFVKDASVKLIEFKREQEDLHDIDKYRLVEGALWYAVIIQYGHCFNKSTSNFTKLEASMIEKGADKKFKQVHDELLTLRHHFIAHRGDTYNEDAAFIMTLPKTAQEISIAAGVNFQMIASKSTSPGIEILEGYIELVDFLLKKVAERIAKLSTDTMGKYLRYIQQNPTKLEEHRIK